MTRIHQLVNLGQSIWLDFIRRSFINSGELQRLVDQGLRGVTSNPSIFEQAIAGSADYDEELAALVEQNRATAEIYEALVLEDIQQVADILRPVYDATKDADGYVSLEVSPTLAHDTDGTVAEARRLFALLDRPNVMIKVPATQAGVPAIETLISDGININVTLIFSVSHYKAVVEAYIRGLEKLAASGGDVSQVASVASFFISRVDTAIDNLLEGTQGSDLRGKIAIANAKVAYTYFQQAFGGARWDKLSAQGARMQRPLWASTGTKNPEYPNTLYIDSLVGTNTVNTVPPATLSAFLDHGRPELTLSSRADGARAQLVRLSVLGIDLDTIAQKLQDDGVAAFVKAFEALMASISAKRDKLLAEWNFQTFHLGSHQTAVDAALEDLKTNRIMSRIWAHDHTVWKPEPEEITNRLGWLDIADRMVEMVPRLESLANGARTDGYTHALLLGMGGSSLAPEVFRSSFGVKNGYLDLSVLDSTDPGAVLACAEQLNPRKTLFLVSTKSGDTVETLSFFKFFYNRVVEALGREEAGAHFVAITDPGSKLEAIARQYHFRATFLNDPNIGGRYSALSYFGVVPAALIGLDLVTLLDRAITMACNCDYCNCPVDGDNNGARLGAVMSELAKAGRDKITLITSPAITGFGNWLEQLIAESTGKEGKGILPVMSEPLNSPEVYGPDRLFVYVQLTGDSTYDTTVNALANAGHPVARIQLDDIYDLGGQFFLWKMATAVAGHRIGINPFDQPNVEEAKVLARQMVRTYQETGKLPELIPQVKSGGILVYGDVEGATPGEMLRAFLDQAQPGAYVALQAYIQPTSEVDAALGYLRTRLRDRTQLATTLGYGPRFLHSTGQLHKGDAGKGLFIQFTADMSQDIAIPDEAGRAESTISFGTLKMAQAFGDRQALLDGGRRVMRIHLGPEPVQALQQLAESL